MKQGLAMGVTAAAMLAASGISQAAPWRHAGTMGMRQFVVVDPAASDDAEMLRQAARAVCTPNQACVVLFWAAASAVPGKMPMTKTQQRAVVAQYFRNPATGTEELLLKCRGDEPRGQKCMRQDDKD